MSIVPPHQVFEHVYVRYSYGDIDDVLSPKGMTMTQQFFVTHESMLSFANAGNKKNVSVDQKLGDTGPLAFSDKPMSENLSVYKSYNTPKNQNAPETNQITFQDAVVSSGNIGRNLQYQRRQPEKEKSAGLEGSNIEPNGQKSKEPMGKESLRESFGHVPLNYDTPSKQRQKMGLLASTEKLEGTHTKAAEERVHRAANFVSPGGGIRHTTVSPDGRGKTAFLSSMNKFLLDAFSPAKVIKLIQKEQLII